MVPRFDEADSLIASVLYRTGIFSQAEKVVAPAFVLRISATDWRPMGVLLLCGLHSSSRNRRAPFCSCMRMSVGLHCVQSAHDILRSRRSRSWQSGGSGVFF